MNKTQFQEREVTDDEDNRGCTESGDGKQRSVKHHVGRCFGRSTQGFENRSKKCLRKLWIDTGG